jgi:hypothetical protein
MNRLQKHPPSVVRNPAYRQAIQRLDQAVTRVNTRNDTYSSWVEAEKLRRIHTILFGCAPK